MLTGEKQETQNLTTYVQSFDKRIAPQSVKYNDNSISTFPYLPESSRRPSLKMTSWFVNEPVSVKIRPVP